MPNPDYPSIIKDEYFDRIGNNVYPCYGYLAKSYRRHENGEFIVFFYEYGKGIVVANSDDNRKQIGEYSETWNMSVFKYLKPENRYSLEHI